MNKRKQTIIIVTIIALMMLVSLGCSVNGVSLDVVEVGELIKETEIVGRDDADEVRVQLKMGAGELQIDGGADELLEADFSYNVADWEPEVDYHITDGNGRLTVRQPRSDKLSIRGNIRYEWDLKFNDDVPLDMRIECGAGQSDIELSSLNITKLDMKLGAGDVDIDLSNNTSLTDFELDMGAGNVSVNLNGDWEHNVDVSIQGGVGQTTIYLPENIGVRVRVDKGIGDVDTSGLYRDGNTYVNKDYEESDTTIEVNIQAGIGQVNLEVVE
jgi:predicted membrane protein